MNHTKPVPHFLPPIPDGYVYLGQARDVIMPKEWENQFYVQLKDQLYDWAWLSYKFEENDLWFAYDNCPLWYKKDWLKHDNSPGWCRKDGKNGLDYIAAKVGTTLYNLQFAKKPDYTTDLVKANEKIAELEAEVAKLQRALNQIKILALENTQK